MLHATTSDPCYCGNQITLGVLYGRRLSACRQLCKVLAKCSGTVLPSYLPLRPLTVLAIGCKGCARSPVRVVCA